uniref:Angiotensin II receptor associated protein n=1 Tax=Strix occidentalis caurina TaxID=311401 RepID=A0A8D0EX85_STROC
CLPLCFFSQAIILVHWLLTVWGCMNYMFPASYAWGNFSVLAVGIWAIVQRDSLDAIMMFLMGLLLTVLTDIIHVSVFYPSNNNLTDAKRFSIGMAIFSLLLKPVSCYLVYRMYRERGGEYTFNIGRMLPLPPCQCGPPPQVLGRPPCTLDPSA